MKHGNQMWPSCMYEPRVDFKGNLFWQH